MQFKHDLELNPRHGLITRLHHMRQTDAALAGKVAWEGDWKAGIRALAANPLVRTIDKAETIYTELAAAHRAHLPERLVPPSVR